MNFKCIFSSERNQYENASNYMILFIIYAKNGKITKIVNQSMIEGISSRGTVKEMIHSGILG